ncbi:YaiI/YqxD family protein [Terribacillus halophilus]|uniref:YaiI/YqxD family protein n=1 Tax=Terribacillus halophilus TaxID=361279 RepID=UPI000B829D50|nr:DUF188 domain-containing protein [Terribacillus halophilus]
MKSHNPIVYVDADSCPVKQEIISACATHHVPVRFITTINHLSSDSDASWVVLDPVDQAVDWYILNHISSGDCVVTQDLALATLLTAKDVTVITPRGERITDADADEILLRKHMRIQNQRQGKRIKGPSKLTAADRSRFLTIFSSFCRKMQESDESC